MNLLRNGLLMRKTRDRRRTELTEESASQCGFSVEFITPSSRLTVVAIPCKPSVSSHKVAPMKANKTSCTTCKVTHQPATGDSVPARSRETSGWKNSRMASVSGVPRRTTLRNAR
jgi:hypothetical protein